MTLYQRLSDFLGDLGPSLHAKTPVLAMAMDRLESTGPSTDEIPRALGSSEREHTTALALELVRKNNELLEENRQMRSAMALWAEAAQGTCRNCGYRPAEPTEDSLQQEREKTLIELGNALLKSLERGRQAAD